MTHSCISGHLQLCVLQDDKCTIELQDQPRPNARDSDKFDAMVLHTRQVCGRSGVFIDIKSSGVLVVAGPRVSTLPALYLDLHGEEDKGLARGRALILSQERFQQLEQLWMTAALDYDTNVYNESSFVGRRFLNV